MRGRRGRIGEERRDIQYPLIHNEKHSIFKIRTLFKVRVMKRNASFLSTVAIINK